MLAKLFGWSRSSDDLPSDLRRSVGGSVLIQMARDAAQTVAPRMPSWSDREEESPGDAKLLAILTYCYAAGICDSQDIERACHDDPAIRSLCANGCPDWLALRRFRYAHPVQIEDCLARVCAAAHGLAPGAARRMSAFSLGLSPEARADVLCSVRRKLRLSILADTAIYEG